MDFRDHLMTVHQRPDQVEILTGIWDDWRTAWLDHYPPHPPTEPHPGIDPESLVPPRPPILEEAEKEGLTVTRNLMTWCWNDVPGSPTQGHFNGNREPSMRLYPENDTFFCHQCGIWGFSDQIKDRDWQGVRR